jgi:DNA-directed RNA polymerase specialized sigma24 family protein
MSVESDDEFRDFMRGRWSAMVRLAYALTGDQGHAEDIAQTAFSSAYSAWGGSGGPRTRTRTCGPS